MVQVRAGWYAPAIRRCAVVSVVLGCALLTAGTASAQWSIPPQCWARCDLVWWGRSPTSRAAGVSPKVRSSTTRRRTWRWRSRTQQLGAFLATGCLCLLPWSALGLFSLRQLRTGLGFYPGLVFLALAAHGLAVAVLWRWAQPRWRRAIVAGALLPVALIGAGQSLAWLATGGSSLRP
ncbi:MAG: hypothetical protein AB7N76_18900 [Planctomycetota bacterium]